MKLVKAERRGLISIEVYELSEEEQREQDRLFKLLDKIQSNKSNRTLYNVSNIKL